MLTPSSSGSLEATLAEIQPFGFLLALDPEWRVVSVSANIANHIADLSQPVAGKPLSDAFGAAAIHAMRNQFAMLRGHQETVRLYSLALTGVSKPFDIAIHRMSDTILLEAFPAAAEPGDPIGTARSLAALLDRYADPDDLIREGAHQLRALTGFEQVTIFRITDDGQLRQVAHEARDKNPAPSHPARSEGLRFIGDIDSDPIAVDPPPGDDLLRNCLLCFPNERERAEARANSAVASLTIPLRSFGLAWGVALCLNAGAKRPVLGRIASAELFADLLAMRAELCVLRR